MAILLIAILLDNLYPYHRGILLNLHPVRTAYFMALALYKKFPKSKIGGVITWLIVVISHLVAYAILLYVSNQIHRVLWIISSAYILKTSSSVRLLFNHVIEVSNCIKGHDMECARESVEGIVRRDVSSLDEGHISSAAIESLFENLVDSFTSPIFYYLFLGPLGALLQRIVNTLDGALGYKYEEFKDVGWFSAKADTVMNYLPARLTSLLIIISCPFVKGSIKQSWAIYLRDRNLTESINAGNPMASASGCLGVKLEKIGAYCIGKDFNLPSANDVAKSIRLALNTLILYFLIITLMGMWLKA